jgi:hypothetical protein
MKFKKNLHATFLQLFSRYAKQYNFDGQSNGKKYNCIQKLLNYHSTDAL